LNFRDIFSKNTQISNFLKFRPVRGELFHVDGQKDGRSYRQTDRQIDVTKLIVTFRDLPKAPKTNPLTVKDY